MDRRSFLKRAAIGVPAAVALPASPTPTPAAPVVAAPAAASSVFNVMADTFSLTSPDGQPKYVVDKHGRFGIRSDMTCNGTISGVMPQHAPDCD